MAEIDLICPWVDGSDPAWQAERNRYASAEERNQQFMWRDWGLMRYWFRGVERALPWIRKMHFVTWGHLPPWLNMDHPKLHMVRHEDFIPKEYLPTFNSITISLNLHRISGLSEQFINANDDTFFLDEMRPDDFFQKGVPCDFVHLTPVTEQCGNGFAHILLNNTLCLNENLSYARFLEKAELLCFSSAYPPAVLKDNQKALTFSRFPGFENPHLPQPMLKSAYQEVWKRARPQLHLACKQRFRSNLSYNEWLVRDWQLATGTFTPCMRKGTAIEIGAPKETLKKAVLSTRHPIVCLNEGEKGADFLSRRSYVQALFQRVLPEKSAFEKD